MASRIISIVARLVAVASLATIAACASTPEPSGKTSAIRYQPLIVTSQPPVQCVPYARSQSGIEIWGNANVWWSRAEGKYPRGSAPQAGSVMVLSGYGSDKRGHVAVVRSMPDRRTLIIDHANWQGKGEINKSAPVRDVSARNDWSAVRVWHIPSGNWGRRVYTVQGFIYPEQKIAQN